MIPGSLTFFGSYDNSCHWKARASYAFYDFFFVYVHCCIYRRVSLFLYPGFTSDPTSLHFRMIATKTSVVVPTRIDWLAMLFMIGIFGFVAQVNS